MADLPRLTGRGGWLESGVTAKRGDDQRWNKFDGQIPIICDSAAGLGRALWLADGGPGTGQSSSKGASAPSDASAPPAPSPVEKAPAAPSDSGNGKNVAARPGVNRGTVLQLLARANPMLWPLAACSIFTVGIALERLLALRRRRVIPKEFVDRFLERLAAGKLDRDRARELCKANESPTARIFAMAVKAWGQPGATIRQNLSFDAAGEVIEMKRNLRVLNGMVTLGPLLGLLGTVVGIIQSFDALGGRIGPCAARPWPRESAWPSWPRRSGW